MRATGGLEGARQDLRAVLEEREGMKCPRGFQEAQKNRTKAFAGLRSEGHPEPTGGRGKGPDARSDHRRPSMLLSARGRAHLHACASPGPERPDLPLEAAEGEHGGVPGAQDSTVAVPTCVSVCFSGSPGEACLSVTCPHPARQRSTS